MPQCKTYLRDGIIVYAMVQDKCMRWHKISVRDGRYKTNIREVYAMVQEKCTLWYKRSARDGTRQNVGYAKARAVGKCTPWCKTNVRDGTR